MLKIFRWDHVKVDLWTLNFLSAKIYQDLLGVSHTSLCLPYPHLTKKLSKVTCICKCLIFFNIFDLYLELINFARVSANDNQIIKLQEKKYLIWNCLNRPYCEGITLFRQFEIGVPHARDFFADSVS